MGISQRYYPREGKVQGEIYEWSRCATVPDRGGWSRFGKSSGLGSNQRCLMVKTTLVPGVGWPSAPVPIFLVTTRRFNDEQAEAIRREANAKVSIHKLCKDWGASRTAIQHVIGFQGAYKCQTPRNPAQASSP